MRNIFKRNQEPMVAPATTTMPAGPMENSTESGGAREGKGYGFATVKDRFFNEMVKFPRCGEKLEVRIRGAAPLVGGGASAPRRAAPAGPRPTPPRTPPNPRPLWSPASWHRLSPLRTAPEGRAFLPHRGLMRTIPSFV
eukprot:bmy_09441T0